MFCAACLLEKSEKEVFKAPCKTDPTKIKYVGMFHCSECGIMCLGGYPHPKICKQCYEYFFNMSENLKQNSF